MRLSWRERKGSAHLLRYEDLIQRPEETLAAVLAYLGVDSRAETVHDVVQRASAAAHDAQQQHQTSTDALASIGRWRRELDEEMQRACHESFGDILEEFGYT